MIIMDTLANRNQAEVALTLDGDVITIIKMILDMTILGSLATKMRVEAALKLDGDETTIKTTIDMTAMVTLLKIAARKLEGIVNTIDKIFKEMLVMITEALVRIPKDRIHKGNGDMDMGISGESRIAKHISMKEDKRINGVQDIKMHVESLDSRLMNIGTMMMVKISKTTYHKAAISTYTIPIP